MTDPDTYSVDNIQDAQTQLNSSGAYGNCEIRWNVASSACSADSTIVISFHPTPNANAGFDDLSCGPVHQLHAIIDIGTGSWWYNNATAEFEDDAQAITNVTVSEYGNFDFRWIEATEFCADTDYVRIRFLEKPQAFAFGDTINCGDQASARYG